MHWTEEATAVARIGVELQNRGWTIYGYKPDRSESMTDYHNPARWDGIATCPGYPGVVVGVKSRGRSQFYTEPYYEGWPAFQATPEGKAWHVEKDGHILATGTGLSKCASHSNGWQKEVARFCDAIERAARQNIDQIAPNPMTSDVPSACTTYEDGTQCRRADPARALPKIECDRDWTWVFFPTRPDEATREHLRGMGARWGRARQGWYLTRHVPMGELAWLTGGIPRTDVASDPIQPGPGGFYPKTVQEALERARFVYDHQPPAEKQDAYDYLPAWLAPHIPPLYTQDRFDDPVAFVAYFAPEGRWKFCVTEYSHQAPDDTPDLFFGYLLSPLGEDCDELCYVTLDQIEVLRSPGLKLPVERDLWFLPKPLSEVRTELAGNRDEPDPAPPAPELVADPPAEAATAVPAEQPSSLPDGPRPDALPEGWTTDDIRHLLDRLEVEPVLVADVKLDIPTIHDFRGCRHLGFGMFELKTADYTLHWDAGGAMQRTPSGKGYTYLHIDGDYAYDTQAVRTRLEAWLRAANGVPPDRRAEDGEPAVSTPASVGIEPASAGNLHPGQTEVQFSHELKRIDKEIKQKRQGLDLAYDVAINDGGARVETLEAEIEAFQVQRQQVVDALLARQKSHPAAMPAAPEPFSITLAQWLERDDHQIQRSGSDTHYVHTDGHRTLWADITSRYAVIVRQHRCEAERAIVENRPITADVLNEYPDLAAQADEKGLSRPPADDRHSSADYRPVWTRTRREFSVSHPMDAAGVPIGKVDAAKERYHEVVVTRALELGYPVPERVLDSYPCLGRQPRTGAQAKPEPMAGKVDAQSPAEPRPMQSAPAYTEADVAEYERAWDVYFETGALSAMHKTVKRIDSVGVLQVAFERAERNLGASTLEERRKIIQSRIRQLQKAA